VPLTFDGRGTAWPKISCSRRPECPAFENREGWGTHCVGDASEIKSLGHPPITNVSARRRF
jgi:hypothetical protein